MTGCSPCDWKHGGFKFAVALMLMGFLPACDHAGNPPSPQSAMAGVAGKSDRKKAEAAFKARSAVFLYRARPDRQHPYDQPVIEKRVVVMT